LLIQSLKRVVDGVREWACDQCDKKFGQAGALRKHIRRTHTAAAQLVNIGPLPLRVNKGTFPKQLWAMLSASPPHDTIRWDDSGTVFIISDTQRFEMEVLPLYFKHRSGDSFVRQLHNYGFQAIAGPEEERSNLTRKRRRANDVAYGYKQRYGQFVRSQPETAQTLRRLKKAPNARRGREDLIAASDVVGVLGLAGHAMFHPSAAAVQAAQAAAAAAATAALLGQAGAAALPGGLMLPGGSPLLPNMVAPVLVVPPGLSGLSGLTAVMHHGHVMPNPMALTAAALPAAAAAPSADGVAALAAGDASAAAGATSIAAAAEHAAVAAAMAPGAAPLAATSGAATAAFAATDGASAAAAAAKPPGSAMSVPLGLSMGALPAGYTYAPALGPGGTVTQLLVPQMSTALPHARDLLSAQCQPGLAAAQQAAATAQAAAQQAAGAAAMAAAASRRANYPYGTMPPSAAAAAAAASAFARRMMKPGGLQ